MAHESPKKPGVMYTTDAVANALGLSPRRVRQLLADGQLPGVRLGGRWRVPADAWRSLSEDALAEAAGRRTVSRGLEMPPCSARRCCRSREGASLSPELVLDR